jgi:hypothetical protein
MASYAASAHIAVTVPRLRIGSTSWPAENPSGTDDVTPEPDGGIGGVGEVAFTGEVGVTSEMRAQVGRVEVLSDEDDGLDAWLERIREAWDQTTWYLFNAEGWR